MPTIQLNNFGGIVPRIHPTLLPAQAATIAHNCVLKEGKLIPLRKAKAEDYKLASIVIESDTEEEIKTMYKWDAGDNTYILISESVIDVVQGNFYEDDKFKLFVAGLQNTDINGRDIKVIFKEDNGFAVRTLYKEKPPTMDVTAVVNITEENESLIRYTYFFQSWVDELGFESECSDPSNEVMYVDGESTITIPAWNNPSLDAKKRRIYKVVTGLETTSIQFVYEQDKEDLSFPAIVMEKFKDENAGEVMPMINNPHIKVHGMCYVSGGFYAMWCGCSPKTVRFSNGAPNDFPDEYCYEVEYEIVGLTSVGNNVYVITKGNPFVISGATPDTMLVTKLASLQGCISRRSICTIDGSVFYVSKDGICMLTEGNLTATITTYDYFTKEQWNEIVDENVIMCGYDNTLYLWNTKKGIGYSICFQDKIYAITTFEEKASAVTVDPITDKMLFMQDRVVKSFNTDEEYHNFTWRSKRIQSPIPFNMSTAQVNAEEYPIELKVDMASSPNTPMDDSGVELNITSQNPRRLPMRRPEKFLELQLKGSVPVTDITISSSMGGIINGNMQNGE